METPLRFPEHKAFLRFVHSAPGGGDELYLSDGSHRLYVLDAYTRLLTTWRRPTVCR